MENRKSGEMFCFQCEQTAGCGGCTKAVGVCGKSADLAGLQDKLTGSLIGLARAVAVKGSTELTDRLMMEGLFATLTNVNFDQEDIQERIDAVHAAKLALAGKSASAPCSAKAAAVCEKIADYSMEELWQAPEDIRSLKSLILFGLRGMAAYAHHAYVLGYREEEVTGFLYRGMRMLGEEHTAEELLAASMDLGKYNLKCMELLDRANTQRFGTPEPSAVTMKVEKGPFIVVTGHDLQDLKLLLEQTEGKGIHIYTHGEMLPAHGYPELKKYSHLKGNYGTAWQNQQKEFADLPAPILFTTNCLMSPKDSYRDRIFTTQVVDYPGVPHIGTEKDFTPVIEKALELGGFSEDRVFTGINGGDSLLTGFARDAVLSHADTVVEAVKAGAIRHFFLVGGCDGARKGRSYYTDFVRQAPGDSIILTLACGKYRFNDMDLGEIGGLPRLMDMGQCNDAYSAIRVALALSEAFQCGVNDLPLTLVLSWYEQKAVCILLTLLHLGIKNIYLGPTLPAFLSENVVNFLVENFELHPITTPEEDLKKILGTAGSKTEKAENE